MPYLRSANLNRSGLGVIPTSLTSISGNSLGPNYAAIYPEMLKGWSDGCFSALPNKMEANGGVQGSYTAISLFVWSSMPLLSTICGGDTIIFYKVHEQV